MRFPILRNALPFRRPAVQAAGGGALEQSADVWPQTGELAVSEARLLRRAWALMLAAAVVLLLVFTLTPLDYLLADRYYLSDGHFLGQGNWWLETFSHVLVKRAGILVLVLVWLRVIAGYVRPAWAADRRRWLAVALAMSLAPATVSLLKPISGLQCPWDLTRYGGQAWDHVSWLTQQLGVRRGGCFPAGHATSGFGFFGLVLLYMGRAPRKAYTVGGLALMGGLSLGWGQQMRGAHFLSHTLWSAWVCWAVCLAIFGVMGLHRANKE